MTTTDDKNKKTVPWYDYSRGGLLDPLALKPPQTTVQPLSKCCGGGVVEDGRVLHGPEDNDGMLLSRHDAKNRINNINNNIDSSNDEHEEEENENRNTARKNNESSSSSSSSFLETHTFNNNKVVVVLNLFAGKGRGKKVIWPKLEVSLQSSKIGYELFETKHPGHATEYFSTLSQLDKIDAILVIGGDGTVNEVANGLLTRTNNGIGNETATEIPPIGILPGGTGNSTLVALGMDDPQIAIDACLDGKKYIKFDIAKCTYGSTTRYILQLFGWGLGVDANIRAEKMRWMGPSRYDIAAVLEIFSGKKRNLHIKGKYESSSSSSDDHNNTFELVGDYAISMIMNCEIGGADMRLAPYAKVNDGYFDLMAAKGRPRFKLLKLFDDLKRNGCHSYDPHVYQYRFQELTLDTPGEQKPVNLDGENCAHTPIHVKVIPRAIKIFVVPSSSSSDKKKT